MSKKRKQEEGEAENNDRWMLTYSDMITLLLALFIILYSMSKADADKFQEIASQFSSAFHVSNGTGNGRGSSSGTGYDDSGIGEYSNIGFIDDSSADSEDSNFDSSDTGSSGTGNSGTGDNQNPLDEIYTTLSKYVSENHLQDEISLTNTSTFVQIRIQGVLMFYPDSPKLLDSSKPVMQKLSEALGAVYDRVDHITITGHTADVGEHNPQTDSFSWYLSINRADTVRQCLVDNGLKEDKLSLEGYAHYNPIAPNDTEENRAKNRRAEITVYKYQPNQTAQTNSDSEANQGVSSNPADDTVE